MNLLIRADASADMGTGHVMRCLALAQGWIDRGGRVEFALARGAQELGPRLEAEGVAAYRIAGESGGVDDATQTAALAAKLEAQWVAVDGYQFDASYQCALKRAGMRVLFLDDAGHGTPYSADIVLNQNLHAEATLYQEHGPDTRLLLGTRFALLRREFQAWQNWRRPIPKTAHRLLVTLGGSDPTKTTPRLLAVLERMQRRELEALVIAGIANPLSGELRALAARLGDWLRIEPSVPDMPGALAWADIAVSAAGGTCWEMLFMQLPGLLVATTPSAQSVFDSLTERGLFHALHLEGSEPAEERLRDLLDDAEERARMSELGRQTVDGHGVEHVLEAMLG
jgi:UDP-2,4-diacetamido-2,4,6-trideoxy-beta-L-altropyranose hydrolase